MGHRTAKFGLAALGLTMVAVTVLIFDVVRGRADDRRCVVMVFYALVWVALPMSLLRQEGRY